MLTELCLGIVLYNSKAVNTNPSNDGAYRSSKTNNDEAFYQFAYKVNATETGDIKQHIETRLKNEVRGAYFLEDPNGARRYVTYVANENGFNAVVRHQFGVEYSKNVNPTNFTRSSLNRQPLHTNVLDYSKVNKPKHLPQQQIVAFERLLQKYRSQSVQQSGKYRQSSPKSITNQTSIRRVELFGEQSANMSQSQSAHTPSVEDAERRQQYEVIDPEADIDIRRSIQKPFLNLDKLKQPRKE